MSEQRLHDGRPLEGGLVTEGLDYYKPTMSQLAYEQEPGAEVTFTFHNRGKQRLLDYVDPARLQAQFDDLRERGWTLEELDYFRGLRTTDGQPVFDEAYLNYLYVCPLPPVEVRHDEARDDLAIDVAGPWALSTFWETVVMSKVNEAYFDGYLRANNLDSEAVYAEGDRRLSEKISVLQQHPEIRFADFGTRRHFSFQWQRHVVERLVAECPGNLIGTSNIALARELEIKPIGTFAHELPMVYAGLAQARGRDIPASHNRLLQDWFDRYGEDYSIALTDTFTSEFFFCDFTPEQAKAWRGVRQDSGDPYAFGERLVEFYEAQGIDPHTKTVVFSDGLDIDTIVDLSKRFEGRIKVVFGWGTTLTNDLGIKPLNIVMKATHVRDSATGREADTVKLSDSPGKYTGPLALVETYKELFSQSKETI